MICLVNNGHIVFSYFTSVYIIIHACWCNKAVIVLLCVGTGDNQLAKARGLPSRTYAQTIQ